MEIVVPVLIAIMDKDVLWQQQASLDNNECTINILKFMWYDGEGS